MRVFFFFPFLSLLVHAQSQCFSPDGKVLPSDGGFFSAFEPCSSGGPSTICCASNRTNPAGGDAKKGDTKDECLPNGLCQNRNTQDGVEKSYFFANFCTDSNFTSGNCLDICKDARGGGSNIQVTPCTGKADSDRWCCGQSNACCKSGIGLVSLPQKFGGAVNIVSSSVLPASSSMTRSSSSQISSASSSATNAPVSSSSTTPTPIPEKKNGLGGGAIAGIVIGALVGVALLGAAIFFAMRANKYKKASAHHPAEVHGHTAIPPQYDGYARSEKYARQQGVGQYNGVGQYSPGSDVPLAELQQPPSELPGSHGGIKAGR